MPTPYPLPPDPTPGYYHCPTCGIDILPMHEFQTLWALKAGGMLQTEAHGLCINCGGAVHFQINTQRLQRLLDRQGITLSEQELNEKKSET